MATPFVTWCNSVGELRDYEYFPTAVLFVKTKEILVNKFAFLLRKIFVTFCEKPMTAF